MRPRWLLPVAALVSAAPVGGAPVCAIERVLFEGTGQAAVANGDSARARDRALEDALKQAVDAALTATLSSLPAGANDPRRAAELRLMLLPRARELVQSYRVLDESDQAGLYRVHVEARVAAERLGAMIATPRETPGAVTTGGVRPRVLVCVGGDAHTALDAERRADAQLVQKGLEPASAPSLCASPGATLDEAAARRALADAHAAFALVGEASAQAIGTVRGTRLLAAHAEAKLALLDGDAHKVAAADEQGDAWHSPEENGGAAALDAALAAAVDASLSKLSAAIASRSANGALAASGPRVVVEVSGVERFGDLEAAVRALAAVPGVSSVAPRRFSSRGVELEVRTQLPASSIAQSLATLGGAPDALRAEASVGGDGRVHARLIPPPPAPPAPAPSSAPAGSAPATGAGPATPPGTRP